MAIRIRSEVPSDIAAIENVIAMAFRFASHSSGAEQFIVRVLRDSGQLALSLVADDAGHVVGHVAVSPVTVSDGASGWFGLGPLAVAPEHQHKSIGSQLVRRTLEHLQASGASGCVVLGDPHYYSRFGFASEPSLTLPSVPAEYFQTVTFRSTLPSGSVAYHEAFSAQG